jgi:DNA repair exonuclease SbcCD ATPase subunit
MARYQVVITGVTAANIKVLEKLVKNAFGDQFAAQVMRQDPGRSRADRLSEAESDFENAKSVVEDLKDEISSWREGLPENLQSSAKADELQECEDALQEIVDNMDQVDFGNVTFPGMMG